jgi:ABC-type dipeptide/oligopeptide/nickel transport system permease subunit
MPRHGRRWNPRLVVGGAVIALLVLVAVLAPVLSPADPLEMGPSLLAPPSREHLLGTDSFGRDVLTRLLYGSRISLLVAGLSVAVSASVGTVLGLVSATARGAVDWLIMRAMDVILAFPPILLAIAVVTFLGAGLGKLAMVIAVLYVPTFARLAYGSALGVAHKEFVEAARALGASAWHQMSRHVLPNIAGPIIVQGSLSLGFAILVESGLSFLGLGILPPTATWGRMVSESRNYLQRMPLLLIWPSLAIALAIGAFNLMGDGLRDRLDPKLRGSLRAAPKPAAGAGQTGALSKA